MHSSEKSGSQHRSWQKAKDSRG